MSELEFASYTQPKHELSRTKFNNNLQYKVLSMKKFSFEDILFQNLGYILLILKVRFYNIF